MADGVLYSQRVYRGPKLDANRMLVSLIILLTVIILGELVFHLLVAPNLVIRKVMVESELALSDEEILRLAGLRSKEYYFALDPETVRRNLETFPRVRKAVIEKVFPDTVRIVLYERKPLAISFAESTGRTVPLAIDREGVIFQMGDEVDRLDLPVISGIRFETAQPGMRLPETLTSVPDGPGASTDRVAEPVPPDLRVPDRPERGIQLRRTALPGGSPGPGADRGGN